MLSAGARTGVGFRALLTDPRGFGRNVFRTALLNVIGVLAGGVAGVIIARALGPAARGSLASVAVWFATLLVVGVLGQTAAVTYFVARDPERGADYLATSRRLMITSGMITLTLGMFLAPALASGNDALVPAFRLMFATCLVAFVGAPYVFALQAVRLALWNVVRVAQALAYVTAIATLHLTGALGLMTALIALSGTVLAQTVLAYLLCRRRGLTGGRARISMARPMTRFGLSHLAAMVPMLLTNRLDQLFLSFATTPAAFGNYAVAASVTGLAFPIVSAIGIVALPRLASRAVSRSSRDHLNYWSLVGSAAIATVLMLSLSVSAVWLVPALFGAGFRAAVPLIWLLAPGGVFLACGQVGGDLLRGHGRPIAVAPAQGLSAVAMAVFLLILFPVLGVAGAAIASSAAAGVALLLIIIALVKLHAESAGPPVPVATTVISNS